MLGAELVERQKLVEPQNKIEHNQADNGPKQNHFLHDGVSYCLWPNRCTAADTADRKSTRLNSSHVAISYAVFCLTKKIARPHPQPVSSLLSLSRPSTGQPINSRATLSASSTA